VNVAATFSGGSVGIQDTTSILSSNVPIGSLVLGNGALCVDNGGNDCSAAPLVQGKIYVDDITLNDIDLAEDFPIEQEDQVQPGDIVAIDSHVGQKCVDFSRDANGTLTCAKSIDGLLPFVTRSSSSGNLKRVIGVVSTDPGVLLGGFGRKELLLYRKVPVALAGRIPVNVSPENGPIEIGDRIVPSSKPGVGMRADDRAGRHAGIVGIAIEPLESDSKETQILILVGAG
jgi:hypothetical protein